jgi:hypothetical protein
MVVSAAMMIQINKLIRAILKMITSINNILVISLLPIENAIIVDKDFTLIVL